MCLECYKEKIKKKDEAINEAIFEINFYLNELSIKDHPEPIKKALKILWEAAKE